MGGFEKVALKKAADYAALEFRKTMTRQGGAKGPFDPRGEMTLRGSKWVKWPSKEEMRMKQMNRWLQYCYP
jgi:hypothetical protein